MGYLFLWSSISSQKYEQELFKLALPCLSAVAGALPPDYMESNYVSMMEKQSSMDSEGNFNPQPVDTSKYGLFLLQQIFIVNDVWSLKLNKVLKWTFSHPCPLWIGILLIGVPLRDEMIVVIIMVTWIPEIDKMYLLRDILLTSPGFSVCNHMVISIIMRIKKGYQLSFQLKFYPKCKISNCSQPLCRVFDWDASSMQARLFLRAVGHHSFITTSQPGLGLAVSVQPHKVQHESEGNIKWE